MIIHCSQKLAAKLPDVSPTSLAETGPLGGWHGHLFMPACADQQGSAGLGACGFDTATDRSVQGSLRVAKQDLEALLYDVPNVMELDPVAVSCNGKPLWTEKAMLALVAGL
jgi:hypothetical protein